LAPLSTAGAATFSGFDQPTLLYLDAGAQPFVSIAGFAVAIQSGTQAILQEGSVITISGYLIDCSASPCAPIAP
jgi:hypothetical protein